VALKKVVDEHGATGGCPRALEEKSVKSGINQQIVIGGVGGQGVLFVTRLLAEAAMRNGFSVLTSETHGMAQRGGTVVSHLKVGNYHGPMIRSGQADGLIALKGEIVSAFSSLLRSGAWVTVNRDTGLTHADGAKLKALNAEDIAMASGFPRSVNLVMLGFSLAVMEKEAKENHICTFADIRAVMETRLRGKSEMLKSSLLALSAGYDALLTSPL
jgi:indolepyruvate ferredoxin oxidoreductase, beta subunit